MKWSSLIFSSLLVGCASLPQGSHQEITFSDVESVPINSPKEFLFKKFKSPTYIFRDETCEIYNYNTVFKSRPRASFVIDKISGRITVKTWWTTSKDPERSLTFSQHRLGVSKFNAKVVYGHNPHVIERTTIYTDASSTLALDTEVNGGDIDTISWLDPSRKKSTDKSKPELVWSAYDK